ncbi:SMP-30/gluconolactonase/LRE family protein [Reichenbachiella ulvae]|uniref:SMP-30/gluconolactonase/LRE family protein n=1 Tax=Reichenbachiella ulvae TaxID=2980104 RepID=A0ABT3CRZ3_9BACT|nr:SMP-30/gluconolactonase/LRE family protein [Reichenbachiella ulvae]MCV9386341.1 SMP-30/gluconolactonase/LRE family protein [Reichenbachiella ulvae]
MKKLLTLLVLLSSLQIHAQQSLGIFDNHLDIGSSKNEGFAFYDASNQTYTLGGSGVNVWGTNDQFHYLWTTIQGDFILRAEVEFHGQGVDPHRKAGWMVKNDLESNTAHVNACTHGDGLTSLQHRKETNGETSEKVSQDSSVQMIQLERRGDTFIMSTAQFGSEPTEVQLDSMPMDTEVYVGLYVCAHNPDITETVTFRNVRISRPAPEDLVPYQDYLGSRLELLDIETGHRTLLTESAHSIQAPNWTPDGQTLIYNSKGRLYNYDLESGNISSLNTGFAINNNNDHVLTFDGTKMGISHHNADDEGNSSIYYLPIEGSDQPIKVTKSGVGASYLHGWSPDESKMIFTGHRKGQYDIYQVDVKTGKETQLTNEKTLDDGSEYSPDGKYIFFNSVRTGTMQLWRMDANGKNPKQLTFDEYNDWFPHVSPDKKWIVFISFPKDINPNDHPFYKRCLIRLMPHEGGEPKVIGYIYGGQGSMNVPNWSPDSKKIALVTNTDN